MNLKELARQIKEKAYIEGDFTLRSGRKSNYLIDKYAFETEPELLASIAEALKTILPADTDRLAGVELGGVPLAVALALETSMPYVIVRKGAKNHGLDRPFEGDMAPGEKIAMLEDITTTGGAAIEAAKTILEAGAGKVTVLGVVDRQEGASEAFEEAGVEFRPLLTKQDLLKV